MINPSTADDYLRGLAYGAKERARPGGGMLLVRMMWRTRLTIASEAGIDDPFARGVVDALTKEKIEA